METTQRRTKIAIIIIVSAIALVLAGLIFIAVSFGGNTQFFSSDMDERLEKEGDLMLYAQMGGSTGQDNRFGYYDPVDQQISKYDLPEEFTDKVIIEFSNSGKALVAVIGEYDAKVGGYRDQELVTLNMDSGKMTTVLDKKGMNILHKRKGPAQLHI